MAAIKQIEVDTKGQNKILFKEMPLVTYFLQQCPPASFCHLSAAPPYHQSIVDEFIEEVRALTSQSLRKSLVFEHCYLRNQAISI